MHLCTSGMHTVLEIDEYILCSKYSDPRKIQHHCCTYSVSVKLLSVRLSELLEQHSSPEFEPISIGFCCFYENDSKPTDSANSASCTTIESEHLSCH